MVGVDPTPRQNSDRAQLILIGAISIAFILLGVVVVFNSVQYTETVNSGNAGEDLDDARMMKSEIESGISELVANDGSYDEDEIEDYVNESYQKTISNQRTTHVSANVDRSSDTVIITYRTSESTITFEVNLPP